MRRLFLAVILAAVAVGGCIKPRPNTAPQPAPLEVPPPPPRVIAPPEPEPEPAAADENPAPAADKPKATRRSAPKVERPAEPPKPEPPPVEPPKPAEKPAATLQPTAQPASPESVKQVEAQLAQAQKDLNRIDVRSLGPDARAQYDAAKQFIAQAGTALSQGNVVFALRLAEKAVGLATGLIQR